MNSNQQPSKFTTYERDGSGNDQAMLRQYHSYWHRFDQPDPYGGSYDVADPQSFNRYSYTQNDPVNYVDPSGLNLISFFKQLFSAKGEGIGNWLPSFDDSAWFAGGWWGGVDDLAAGGGDGSQNPASVPFPGVDAVRNRINTGDCNAYIASLIAQAAKDSNGKKPAVAKDGLDMLGKINGFVLVDHLKIDGYSVGGTTRGSIAGNDATVLMSTRFVFGNNPRAVSMWQANYINTALHEMLHLAGYDDRELAVASSKLPGAASGLPAAPAASRFENGKWIHDMNGILNNSMYWDKELTKHCGGASK